MCRCEISHLKQILTSVLKINTIVSKIVPTLLGGLTAVVLKDFSYKMITGLAKVYTHK